MTTRSQVVRIGPGRGDDGGPAPGADAAEDAAGGAAPGRGRLRPAPSASSSDSAGRQSASGCAESGTAIGDGRANARLLHQRPDEREGVAGVSRRIRLPANRATRPSRRSRRPPSARGGSGSPPAAGGPAGGAGSCAAGRGDPRRTGWRGRLPRGWEEPEGDVVAHRPRGHVREAGQVVEAVRVVGHAAILTLLPSAVKTSHRDSRPASELGSGPATTDRKSGYRDPPSSGTLPVCERSTSSRSVSRGSPLPC